MDPTKVDEFNFARNLKRLRLYSVPQRSQAQLAQKLDISTSTYQRYEKGTQYPTIAFAVKASLYFQVTIDELVFGEVLPNRNRLESK